MPIISNEDLKTWGINTYLNNRGGSITFEINVTADLTEDEQAILRSIVFLLERFGSL